MSKVKRLWMPVLLGALLMATFVGVAGARPNTRPEASPGLVNHMFSADHCTATIDGMDWTHKSECLESNTTMCGCLCPSKPPHSWLTSGQPTSRCLCMHRADLASLVCPRPGTRNRAALERRPCSLPGVPG